jgi:hypothetical protein
VRIPGGRWNSDFTLPMRHTFALNPAPAVAIRNQNIFHARIKHLNKNHKSQAQRAARVQRKTPKMAIAVSLQLLKQKKLP